MFDQSNASSKYTLKRNMYTGLIGFLNHKFYVEKTPLLFRKTEQHTGQAFASVHTRMSHTCPGSQEHETGCKYTIKMVACK